MKTKTMFICSIVFIFSLIMAANFQPVFAQAADGCVIPESGPWPPCATGGTAAAPTTAPAGASTGCVIPPSGPWPPCATGGGSAPATAPANNPPAPPPGPGCVIPDSGPWPPCATSGSKPAAATGNFLSAASPTVIAGSAVALDWNVDNASTVEISEQIFDTSGFRITTTTVGVRGPRAFEIPSNISDRTGARVTYKLLADGVEVANTTVKIDCEYEWFFTPQPRLCGAQPKVSPAAQQEFQGGTMVWIQSEDMILVFVRGGSVRWEFKDEFVHGVHPDRDLSIVPPDNFQQPGQGFGKVWRENAQVRELLGWALSSTESQDFETVLQSDLAQRFGKQYIRLKNNVVLERDGRPFYTIHTGWNGNAHANNGFR